MTFNTDIVARLMISAFTLYPPYTGWLVPDSLSAQMKMVYGPTALFLFVFMGILAVAILIDVIYNSVIYNNDRIPLLSGKRDTIYMLCGFCAGSVPFAVSKFTAVQSGPAYLYIVIAAGALALAYCDAWAKRKLAKRNMQREPI